MSLSDDASMAHTRGVYTQASSIAKEEHTTHLDYDRGLLAFSFVGPQADSISRR